MQKKIY